MTPRFWGVLRVDASTQASIDRDFDHIRNRFQEYERDRHQQIGRQPCLLILDDMNMSFTYSNYLPRWALAGATILITTKNPEIVRHNGKRVHVGPMQPQDAVRLLLEHVPSWEQSRNQLQPLVEDLGCLPLAICIAGGMTREHSLTIREFQKAYTLSRKNWTLLDLAPESVNIDTMGDRLSSISATFEMSFNKILEFSQRDGDVGENATNALEMLCFFSFLHADEISEQILINACKKYHHSRNLRPELSLLSREPEDLATSIIRPARAILTKYSLIEDRRDNKWMKDQQTYTMHTLIKWCVRRWLRRTSHEDEFWPKAMFTLAHALSFHSKVYDPTVHRASTLHIDACIGDTSLADHADLRGIDAAWLVFARVYCDDRRISKALRLREQTLKHRQSCKSDDPLAELDALHDLAISLRDRNEILEAARIRQDVFKRRQAIWTSKESTENAHSMKLKMLEAQHCHAESEGDLHRWHSAVQLEESVVHGRRELLGEHSIKTLAAQRRLARMYDADLQHARALELLEKIMKVCKDLEKNDELAINEPAEMLLARADLAFIYDRIGRCKEARLLRVDRYERELKVHSDEFHLDVLASRLDCAISSERFESYDFALKEMAIVSREYARQLGNGHRQTLHARESLARCYEASKKLDDAIDIRAEILHELERASSPDYEMILEARASIATLEVSLEKRHRMGPEKKEQILKKHYKIVEEWTKLYPNHSKRVWPARIRLAMALSRFRQHKTAHSQWIELLKDQEAESGKDSYDVLDTRYKLAKVLGKLGQREQQRAMYAELLTARKRVDSTNHVLNMQLLREHIYFLRNEKAREQQQDAGRLLEELLQLQITILGIEHPATHQTLTELTNVRRYLEAPEGDDSEVESTDFVEHPPSTTPAASESRQTPIYGYAVLL